MMGSYTHSQLMEVMKEYSVGAGHYDFNGLLHLILSGVDNMIEHSIDADLEDYACSITDKQAAFLQRLLDARGTSHEMAEPKGE